VREQPSPSACDPWNDPSSLLQGDARAVSAALGFRPQAERSELSRALAKALAYRDCGKAAMRDQWARELVVLLGAAGILKDGAP